MQLSYFEVRGNAMAKGSFLLNLVEMHRQGTIEELHDGYHEETKVRNVNC